MRYRRALLEGATYFFTVNLADRSSRLLVDRVADLREAVRRVRLDHPFDIIAWVVMPDHVHAVWRLPDTDADYSTRWALIKANFSRTIPKAERIGESRQGKGERGIWQRRFWEHVIRDETDLQRHVDYTHYNPVKHGYVQRAVDWPFSSFQWYLRRGWVSADWGCAGDDNSDFGERR
ncbi:transposase [uncultured Thiodictyon sp.]|uniref:REP-associated tyrosine transposase n=1 Tax=uncultured Thiodictyon sp. TaxID=1846217 RepID=UPI0025D2B618|nr:transposase [uncultured Thiodictyon sp.]